MKFNNDRAKSHEDYKELINTLKQKEHAGSDLIKLLEFNLMIT